MKILSTKIQFMFESKRNTLKEEKKKKKRKRNPHVARCYQGRE